MTLRHFGGFLLALAMAGAACSKGGSSHTGTGASTGTGAGVGTGDGTGAGVGVGGSSPQGTCAAGLADCGAGTCIDTATSPTDCGHCGDACGAGQICVDGACATPPTTCPCPIESYCDLATSTCKTGCTDDTECSTGRICDTTSRECQPGCHADDVCSPGKICVGTACETGCRMDPDCGSGKICQAMKCESGCRMDTDCGKGDICDDLACRPGCRLDADCGAGVVCDPTTLTCRSGCTTDAQCPLEQICNPSKTCVPGCDGDARCNPGQICTAGMCVMGCETSSSCATNHYCDPSTKQCVPGCDGNPKRCDVGEACVDLVDGTTDCRAACNGETCNGSNYECYAPGYDDSASMCRIDCTTDADCASGERCTWFTNDPSNPGDDSVSLCAKPCSVSGCADAIDDYANVGNCACNANGSCESAGYVCFQGDSSYGK